jgi:hypothetical protein
MRYADANHQGKEILPHRYLPSLAILTFCLLSASGSISLAQSGRKGTQSQAETVPQESLQTGRDDQKDQVPPPAFIVITAAPDNTRSTGFQAGFSQPVNLEYYARGGCLLELRSIAGAKVAEDEDVARWEARETALADNKSWVIWMELRWDKPSSTYDPTPFRLRYLLFEPGTGRIVASGVGKGVKQVWGTPLRRGSLEEEVRQAGRDIAAQVVSELRKSQ